LLKEINSGSASSRPGPFFEYDGKLYFAAATADAGRELWQTDGTGGGTLLVENISADALPTVNSSEPSDFAIAHGQMVFAATTAGGGREPWVLRLDQSPVITLLGENPVSIPCGTTYNDAGATATDAEDGNLTAQIVTDNPVNTAVAGTYTVTYTVRDNQGNAAVPVTRTVTVEGPCVGQYSSADTNHDNAIGLSELLRVIQLFNSNGYHCQAGTEDGYAPGPGGESCVPHSSDYAPQDWTISLSELLRLIQFFNSGGYHACPGMGTEDGYCVGP
jgi:ELWxxDGT repeat protein